MIKWKIFYKYSFIQVPSAFIYFHFWENVAISKKKVLKYLTLDKNFHANFLTSKIFFANILNTKVININTFYYY